MMILPTGLSCWPGWFPIMTSVGIGRPRAVLTARRSLVVSGAGPERTAEEKEQHGRARAVRFAGPGSQPGGPVNSGEAAPAALQEKEAVCLVRLPAFIRGGRPRGARARAGSQP